MKCNHCQAQWSVNAQVASQLNKCPFCGAPLVSPAQNTSKELSTMADVLQEGENGYEYTSSDEFLHAIDAVMDPAWRASACKRSEEIAASFDKKAFGDAIESLYESVL